jgi:hypothetical protein
VAGSASSGPHHVAAETVDVTRACECNELHRACLARLEAHGGSSRDVEPEAARERTVETQRFVGLGEVVVRAHLDRTIAGVRDGDDNRRPTGVELDVAVAGQQFAGDHCFITPSRSPLMESDCAR